MVKKIVNAVVFALAIVVGILAVVFVSKYDEEKKVQYKSVGILRTDEATQKVLDELATVKVGTLDSYLKKTQDQYNTLDSTLKVQKKQADDFYTYINVMKTNAAEDFTAFKTTYPNNVASILSFDGKTKLDSTGNVVEVEGDYVKAFKGINDADQLAEYVTNTLSTEYDEFHQDYLRKDEVRTALKEYIKNVDAINALNDVKQKEAQLKDFQADVVNFGTMENNLLAPAFIICYVLVCITILILVVFALIKLVTNIKTSYKSLIVIIGLCLVAILCYAIASPDVNNEIFNKLQITPGTGKLIEAGCYFAYVIFGLVVLAIICCPIISWARNRKSL